MYAYILELFENTCEKFSNTYFQLLNNWEGLHGMLKLLKEGIIV